MPPESDYRFKHALIQDAAYENLLKSRRQVLHRRVAEILRDRFAATAAAEPEVLAHHFTQAGLTDAAIEWWGKAGDQASAPLRLPGGDLASRQGDRDGGQGRREHAARDGGATSARGRLKLQTTYGQALFWAKGYAAPETVAAFARARDLPQATTIPADRFATLLRAMGVSIMRARTRLGPSISGDAPSGRGEARRGLPKWPLVDRIAALRLLLAGCILQRRKSPLKRH